MMGNRGGRFHLPGRVLGRRRWASRQWIACVCQFRGRQRQVWGHGYTELFFLDEVTALASGHRPCFECRRADALAFRDCFGAGGMRAGAMDLVLHAERLARPRPALSAFADLPDGSMLAIGDAAFAIRDGRWLRWSFDGYHATESPDPLERAIWLTPPSIVAALRRGYRPAWYSGKRHLV